MMDALTVTPQLILGKYPNLAGYEDKEIPALLHRTAGRVAEADYL